MQLTTSGVAHVLLFLLISESATRVPNFTKINLNSRYIQRRTIKLKLKTDLYSAIKSGDSEAIRD